MYREAENELQIEKKKKKLYSPFRNTPENVPRGVCGGVDRKLNAVVYTYMYVISRHYWTRGPAVRGQFCDHAAFRVFD